MGRACSGRWVLGRGHRRQRSGTVERPVWVFRTVWHRATRQKSMVTFSRVMCRLPQSNAFSLNVRPQLAWQCPVCRLVPQEWRSAALLMNATKSFCLGHPASEALPAFGGQESCNPTHVCREVGYPLDQPEHVLCDAAAPALIERHGWLFCG